jgi:hypothetical protein
MDTVLVVNAGSSSVKFQVFAADGKIGPRRLIKGQMDGIGTRPRLRAEAADKTPLIDQTYVLEQVGDVPAALQIAGSPLLPSPPSRLSRVAALSRSATLWSTPSVFRIPELHDARLRDATAGASSFCVALRNDGDWSRHERSPMRSRCRSIQ